jgi:hypothetical protein
MPERGREISPGSGSQNGEDAQNCHREREIQRERVDELSGPDILWEQSR